MVTMVLLKVASTCATPVWTFLAPLALMILICSTTAFGSSERFSGFFSSAGSRGGFLLGSLLGFGALGSAVGRGSRGGAVSSGSGARRRALRRGAARRAQAPAAAARGRGGLGVSFTSFASFGGLRFLRFSHNVLGLLLGLGVLGADDADGLARALAGAGIGLRALAADGQAAAMADAAVTIDRLEALEIALDIAAQIALDQQAAAGDGVDDRVELLDAQILGADVGIDVGGLEDLLRGGSGRCRKCKAARLRCAYRRGYLLQGVGA